jgi:nicotinate-nucleotide pyrophosphorylase
VLAGIEVFERVLSRLDPKRAVECNFHDGDIAAKAKDIGVVKGSMKR